MRGTWIRNAPTWAWVAAGIVALATIAPALAGQETENDDGTSKKKVRVVVKEKSPSEKGSAYLGVSLTEDTESPEGGARIDRVLDDSPAEKAGLKEGDVVVAFRDQTIRGPASLTKQIQTAKPGDKVPLSVIRDGKRETVTVEMGERRRNIVHLVLPDHEEDLVVPLPDMESLNLTLGRTKEDMERQAQRMKELQIVTEGLGRAGRGYTVWFGRPKLGVEMVTATPELREFLGGPKDAGVIVGKVISGSAAEKAGIKVGDLIVSADGDRIGDPSDLVEALADKDGETVEIELVRDKRTVRIRAAIPENQIEQPAGPRAFAPLHPPAVPPLPAAPMPTTAPLPPAAPEVDEVI